MKYTFIAAMFAACTLALTACGEKKKAEETTQEAAPATEAPATEAPAPAHEAPAEPTHESAPESKKE